MRRVRFLASYILLAALFMCILAGCNNTTATAAYKEMTNVSFSEDELNTADMSMETAQKLELKYKLYIPDNISGNMPLLVYLHGASGKGDDLSLLTKEEDLPKFLENGAISQLDAYVLMPQLSLEYRSWSDIEKSLCELTEKIIEEYSIDKDNVSLAGFSMGGTGAWNIGFLHSDIFSKIIPISGSAKGVLQSSGNFNNNVWTFVGALDTVISPNSSKQMIKELVKNNLDAQITEFEGAAHEDVPSKVWLECGGELIQWITQKNTQGNASENLESNKELETNQNTSNQKDEMNMYSNSDFIEKEKPELDEETKKLIKEYHKNPSDDNYNNLKQMVIANYNEVLKRKEDKLAELKLETSGKPGGTAIVTEMEELIQDMYDTYDIRIDSSMLRFTDPRFFDWNIADAKRNEFIPVMGAGEEVYISKTTVTNKQYMEFINATGYKVPNNWINGTYPTGEDDYPVNFVSYDDAVAYCDWLTKNDRTNIYRLPTEMEWELAAGHMPKDADFNCGINDGRTSVYEYAQVTMGAHGAIDFWGNVWEWTSTVRSSDNTSIVMGVKGGAWDSDRTDCRTEYREEGRESANGYENVGFRVILIKK